MYTFFLFACVYTDNEQWINRWMVSGISDSSLSARCSTRGPEQELDGGRSGGEKALKRGTGVGLWVVGSAAATVEYETGTDGTVRFSSAPAVT